MASDLEPGSLPAPDEDGLAHSAALVERIAREIEAAGGWLPFSRFMELALYTPGLGYYSGGSVRFGRRPEDGSDFVTAPELTPLFARTVARPVADALVGSGTRTLYEFGAGTGKLAAGLLETLDQWSIPFDRYTIVDLSGALREQQRQTIAARVPHLVDRVEWLDTLPERIEGVVIGNEVLDAMPVRLHTRAQDGWLERGVVVDAEGGTEGHAGTTSGSGTRSRFAWSDRATPLDDALLSVLDTIDADEGFVTESHEAARAFTRTLAEKLERGVILLIDYGFPEREYYHPQRVEGTLMCHYRHRAHGDPFVYPGLQDITAHVDFTGIAQAGIDAGADLLGYMTQGRFLLNSGLADTLTEFDPRETLSFLPAANAVQKLVSEAEMGELFKVIAFGKGVDPDAITAFVSGDRSHTL
ncbi:class I SAM-dependent methyltransferase [Pararobbsia silviterrae]|uniref:Class I SAM-dependent methyltransferase n=1 Tax=Pararobbsia silviterrae TaxID=1792498 RepID=A0A494YE85_9BURK|nr:SAM-dependent methyltransferase [Pararobbsia silviterrae]RKP58653.1 class I SAM-dependent methyltransferase [Pararobbsia silviterrae]